MVMDVTLDQQLSRLFAEFVGRCVGTARLSTE